MIDMAEELGLEMAIRSLEHLLQYGEHNIRRSVLLALGILSISNPKVNVMDTLSRLSHDSDYEVAMPNDGLWRCIQMCLGVCSVMKILPISNRVVSVQIHKNMEMEKLQELHSVLCSSSSSFASNLHPLDVGAEEWERAERRVDQILSVIQPTVLFERMRKEIIEYIQIYLSA